MYTVTSKTVNINYKLWQEWIRDPGNKWIVSGTNATTNYASYVNKIWPTWTSAITTSHATTITIPFRDEVTRVDERAVERAVKQAKADQARRVAIEVQKEEAEKRSLQLLCFALSEEQRQELAEHERITVYSQLGNFYCLTIGWSHNVYLLDEQGKPIRSYCAHVPQSKVPVYDNVLAQILMLQNNEKGFLSIANKRDIDPNSRMGRTPMISMSSELILPGNPLVSGLKGMASRIRDLIPA